MTEYIEDAWDEAKVAMLTKAAESIGWEFEWREGIEPRARKPNGVAGWWNPFVCAEHSMMLMLERNLILYKLGNSLICQDEKFNRAIASLVDNRPMDVVAKYLVVDMAASFIKIRDRDNAQ